MVWSLEPYGFLSSAEAPPTVNPSLWRQSRLNMRHGLFEVVPGVYQVRGLDISNMTLVEGTSGVIVIDPLISVECAEAALRLYRKNRGDRPVTGVIYTHPHADHFGGVRGVLPPGTEGGVPILAPAGFMEHAVSENVYAGNAMARRATFMYGNPLPKGPEGQIGVGLGMVGSTGTVSLIPPTLDVIRTGQVETLDGVQIVFQLTPGTEAPAEMNFLFPGLRALCLAENATHNMHNVLTLRGALVRDARMWSRYLDEAIDYFDGQYDVAFASHHWPTWGEENVRAFLVTQRDLYAYIHDQTLRLLNDGLTGPEIAEQLELPPGLELAWSARGYYGSLSHNVKAVYQRYLGWYDGNPAHLWELPPVELARQYVHLAGGVGSALAAAMLHVSRGENRFAATLLNHIVFADPANEEARELLARVYTELGQGSENGTWRSIYLTAAMELREGPQKLEISLTSPEMVAALSTEQLIDSLAIRVDGVRAGTEDLTVDWVLADEGRRYRLTLHNGALTHRWYPADAPVRTPAGLTMTMTRPMLLALLDGRPSDEIRDEGDPQLLGRLFSYLTAPDPMFPVVTP